MEISRENIMRYIGQSSPEPRLQFLAALALNFLERIETLEDRYPRVNVPIVGDDGQPLVTQDDFGEIRPLTGPVYIDEVLRELARVAGYEIRGKACINASQMIYGRPKKWTHIVTLVKSKVKACKPQR